MTTFNLDWFRSQGATEFLSTHQNLDMPGYVASVITAGHPEWAVWFLMKQLQPKDAGPMRNQFLSSVLKQVGPVAQELKAFKDFMQGRTVITDTQAFNDWINNCVAKIEAYNEKGGK